MNSHLSRVAVPLGMLTAVLLLGWAVTIGGAGVAQAAVVSTVGLGTAADFGVLGGSTVTNTGASSVNGLDVGVSPGSEITGFPPGLITPPGVAHAADQVAGQAQSAALTAYNDAAGRPAAPADSGLTDLVGKTLQPGVYQGNLSLSGTVTLDNSTDPDAVFIFQASSTLITSSASVVKFTTSHASCNVFWQVGSSATLGTGSTFVGTILAHIAVTAQTSATVTGRLLAASGAVTLDSNVINAPSCSPPTTSSSTSSSSTPSSSTPSSSTPSSTTSSSKSSGSSSSSASGSSSTSISAPNENTTPSTISLLTTRPSTNSTQSSNSTTSSTRTTRPTSTGATVTLTTATLTTTTLTQPSFPTGVPAGSGPSSPWPPAKVIGGIVFLFGVLMLVGRAPTSRRLISRLRSSGKSNRSGEHR